MKGLHIKRLIASIIFTFIICILMFKVNNQAFILIPFLLISLLSVFMNIASIYNMSSLKQIISKLVVLCFALFWFGFLIFALYISIRDRNYIMILFSIPFWIVGFIMIKNILSK